MHDQPNWKLGLGAIAVLLFSLALWVLCVVAVVVTLRLMGVIQ